MPVTALEPDPFHPIIREKEFAFLTKGHTYTDLHVILFTLLLTVLLYMITMIT